MHAVLEGINGMGAIGDPEFLIDREKFWQGFAACRDEYLAHGVTLTQYAWATLPLLEHFASLPEGDDPGIDVVVLPQGELEPGLSRGPGAFDWPASSHMILGPRKLFADGAFQLQTAWLSEPYHKPIQPDAPCGMPYCEPQVLKAE